MDPMLTKLLEILTPIAVVIAGGLGTVITFLFGRWVTMMKVKASIENGRVAVRSIEQLYPDLPGAVKKELALKFAQTLNMDSNVKIPDATAVQINESHIPELPKTATQPPQPAKPATEETPTEPLGIVVLG